MDAEKDFELKDAKVILEPLTLGHVESLNAAAADGNLWNLTYTIIPCGDGMRTYVQKALDAKKLGTQIPFAILNATTHRVIGSTRFWNIDNANRKLEIGYTWIGKSYQGTHINLHAKYLMLEHAFDNMQYIRVEFFTHENNKQSRGALEKIGAVYEGTLRNHMILPGGEYRNSACYSIIASEWPEVKKRLQDQMDCD